MGRAKNIVCDKCGYEWDHYMGTGFNTAYYHCNQCGKELCVDLNDSMSLDLSSKVKQCSCGGKYETNEDVIICPQCHSKIKEVKETIAILWD